MFMTAGVQSPAASAWVWGWSQIPYRARAMSQDRKFKGWGPRCRVGWRKHRGQDRWREGDSSGREEHEERREAGWERARPQPSHMPTVLRGSSGNTGRAMSPKDSAWMNPELTQGGTPRDGAQIAPGEMSTPRPCSDYPRGDAGRSMPTAPAPQKSLARVRPWLRDGLLQPDLCWGWGCLQMVLEIPSGLAEPMNLSGLRIKARSEDGY